MITQSSRYTCVFLTLCCVLLSFFSAIPVRSQSIQGTILGTVKDSTGSVIPGAEIKITNEDEGATLAYTTDESGNFLIPDLKPGRYRIEVQKDGFKAEVHNGVQLLARQEVREEFVLSVGTRAEIVEVTDAATAINSETPAITASFDSQNVLELPANYRADGSTSPLKLVQSLAGVQPDSDGKYSVQGGLPFMSETSVDGITTQNAGSNNPLSDAWPSAETITELRVDGVCAQLQRHELLRFRCCHRSPAHRSPISQLGHHQQSRQQREFALQRVPARSQSPLPKRLVIQLHLHAREKHRR
jgi:hypothetical protein